MRWAPRRRRRPLRARRVPLGPRADSAFDARCITADQGSFAVHACRHLRRGSLRHAVRRAPGWRARAGTQLPDLLTVIPVVDDQVVHRVSSRTAGATVAGATATTGVTGSSRKAATFSPRSPKPCARLLCGVPATTRVVADAPQLRACIDEYLGADLQTELEDLIVAGDGLGEKLHRRHDRR